MIVSWNWLKQYVRLDMPGDELTHRLMMSGLNHESTEDREGDLAIDLEVTSNRPDCLCHLGIAREVAVLFDRELNLPSADPKSGSTSVDALTSVALECPELCPRYTARLIRGVKIAPSPDWMQRRLATLGVPAIDNVVDITNYVLLECSQPLHAFDLDKLAERRIVVRRAKPGEKIVAINQREYELTSEMCVIADATRPVAVGGVMGGLKTEVSDTTTNLLIESAEFDPLSIRNTSRALTLSSESSYRFERGVDPEGVEWASRRACELILELAGGELAEGVVYAGARPEPPGSVALRFAQLRRILGIEVDPGEARRILHKLGLHLEQDGPERIVVTPPSWRRDLTREIDLIEEVGRIHGYEAVPEDVRVAAAAVTPSRHQQVTRRVRDLLCAAGFDEAVTFSLLDDESAAAFSPWSPAEPLRVVHPSRRRERTLRKSLIPSLLVARRRNEAHGNSDADLFEIAGVYLPRKAGQLPDEPMTIGLVSGRDFAELKGVCELLAEQLCTRAGGANTDTNVSAQMHDGAHHALFSAGKGAELALNGQHWGYLGPISNALADRFKLAGPCTVAELRLDVLESAAQLVAQYEPFTAFPSVDRELNLVVDEAVTWQELADIVRAAAGKQLEDLQFLHLYRGAQVSAGKKSLHFRLVYRAPDRTLTSEEVEAFQQAVLAACQNKLDATLRG